MNCNVLWKRLYYWLLITALWLNICSADIYCIDTELETQVECPIACQSGDMQSILNINEINHESANEINIDIPEELERNYTWNNEILNINIIGYWYDQEKMQSMVNTQYYTPTPEDMNKLIEWIADYLPLLAILLLFVRTWYIIKKVF